MEKAIYASNNSNWEKKTQKETRYSIWGNSILFVVQKAKQKFTTKFT